MGKISSIEQRIECLPNVYMYYWVLSSGASEPRFETGCFLRLPYVSSIANSSQAANKDDMADEQEYNVAVPNEKIQELKNKLSQATFPDEVCTQDTNR